jgi:hypothetical protein
MAPNRPDRMQALLARDCENAIRKEADPDGGEPRAAAHL